MTQKMIIDATTPVAPDIRGDYGEELDTLTRPPSCPRCRSGSVEIRSTSPVAGVSIVYACSTCLYAWRSTEPIDNTEPDHYPVRFRLLPADLPDLPVAPSIPHLLPAPPKSATPIAN
jgi:hypothetical protein